MKRILPSLAISACIIGTGCSSESSNTTSGTGQVSGGEQATRTEHRVPDGLVATVFDLKWELDGDNLLLSIDTDLPDESEVNVTVNRLYYESGNPTAYGRDYFTESSVISRWRDPRQISIDDDAWKADLKSHQDEMAKISRDLVFDIGSISDEIGVRAVVHANQPDRRFGGRGNPKLTGPVVSGDRGFKTVSAAESILRPLAGAAPAANSVQAPFDGLKVGNTYRIPKEVPLMPSRNPSSEDALADLAKIRHLPANSRVYVIRVDDSENWPWYYVSLPDYEDAKAWINSGAFMKEGAILQ